MNETWQQNVSKNENNVVKTYEKTQQQPRNKLPLSLR